MYFIEEKLKERLNDVDFTSQVNREDLWDLIQSDLGSDAKSVSINKHGTRRHFVLFVFLIFSVGVILFCFKRDCFFANERVQVSNSFGLQSKQKVKQITGVGCGEKTIGLDLNTTKEIKNPFILFSQSKSLSVNSQSEKDYFDDNAIENVQAVGIPEFIDHRTSKLSNRFEEIGEYNFSKKIKGYEKIKPLDILETKLLCYNKNLLKLRFPAVDVVKNMQSKWRVGLFAGFNHWENDFSSGDVEMSFLELLEKTSSIDMGYNLSFEIQYDFSRNIKLSSGLGYFNSYNLFKKVIVKDSFMHENNNPLLPLVPATATRIIINHNNHQFFNLPLFIGTTRNLRCFKFGADVGLGLNYVFKQSGKFYDGRNEITEYSSIIRESELLFSNFFFSFQIRPSVSYLINSHLRLQVNGVANFQKHSPANRLKVSHSSLLYGINIGVVFNP